MVTTDLEGCLYLISQEPSARTTASLAMISISLASSSPMRFERMARIMGAMPLETMMMGISFVLHQALKSLNPTSKRISCSPERVVRSEVRSLSWKD